MKKHMHKAITSVLSVIAKFCKQLNFPPIGTDRINYSMSTQWSTVQPQKNEGDLYKLRLLDFQGVLLSEISNMYVTLCYRK